MKIKISELTGAALDWAVAKTKFSSSFFSKSDIKQWASVNKPSTDWSQGGLIIEREEISIWPDSNNARWRAVDAQWLAADVDSDEFMSMPEPWCGSTPLIAAMRCYVASKLGEEVEIPEELLS